MCYVRQFSAPACSNFDYLIAFLFSYKVVYKFLCFLCIVFLSLIFVTHIKDVFGLQACLLLEMDIMNNEFML